MGGHDKDKQYQKILKRKIVMKQVWMQMQTMNKRITQTARYYHWTKLYGKLRECCMVIVTKHQLWQSNTNSVPQSIKSSWNQMEKEDIRLLKESLTDLQWHLINYKVVFAELRGETKEEDTEAKRRDFIYFELKTDWKLEFSNVHRFEQFQQNKSRPIVAEFLYESDRLCVLETKST